MDLLTVAWAASRPSSSSFDEAHGSARPTVELVFPATDKDFPLLPFAIHAAINATKNPISKITVYVPDAQREMCLSAIRNYAPLLNESGSIKIVSDESVLKSESSRALREQFGNRSGWYVQQVIKLSSVLNSSADGVLIVDADTILLQPRLWMFENGKQILMPTYELNGPYRTHLDSLYRHFSAMELSFVSHHMLMQPKILRDILNAIETPNIDLLVSQISVFSQVEKLDDFFSEYELYAHGLITLNPELVEYVKWANLSISRPKSVTRVIALIEQLKKNGEYYSVSMHDYR